MNDEMAAFDKASGLLLLSQIGSMLKQKKTTYWRPFSVSNKARKNYAVT